jgi:hypothetical protein
LALPEGIEGFREKVSPFFLFWAAAYSEISDAGADVLFKKSFNFKLRHISAPQSIFGRHLCPGGISPAFE